LCNGPFTYVEKYILEDKKNFQIHCDKYTTLKKLLINNPPSEILPLSNIIIISALDG